MSDHSARELQPRERALLFTQLAQLERAGIQLLQALPILSRELPPTPARRISTLRGYLNGGMPLARAGQLCGLWLPWEARLIEVAVEGGRLQTVCERLAAHYRQKVKYISTLKSRLPLPVAVLILGTFVAPLPALARGEIGVGAYLLGTAGRLSLLFLSIALLFAYWRRLGTLDMPRYLGQLQLTLPIIGGFTRRQQQRNYLASLALLLETGVPAIEALRLASQSVANPVLRARFALAAGWVADGMPVATALGHCGAIADPRIESLVEGGEIAGRLDAMLTYHIRQLDDFLDARLATIVDWAPRVVMDW
ncbi:MAG: type II secretion system F family protein [Gammaproteobacteria bacterium]